MILFFANNRASAAYFAKIAALLPKATVIIEQGLGMPDLGAFRDPDGDAIATAVDYRNREYQTLNGHPMAAVRKAALGLLARWYYARDYRRLRQSRPELVVVWNGLMFRRSMFVAAARRLGIPCCFMENGLLPHTTVCDPQGINAVNAMPRQGDFYRQLSPRPGDQERNLVVREARTPKKASGQPLPERFLFVPFQVDTDSQIVIFSGWIKHMRQLFEVMQVALPEASPLKLVFKEHPSSPLDYSSLHGLLPATVGMFANEYSTQELIEKADAVVTINSTVGIEALLLGKKVVVLGQAFYRIRDLVLTADNVDELRGVLEELGSFVPDELLRRNFLDYLRHDYLIAGSWKDASPPHCQAVAARIATLARGVAA